MSAQWMRFEFQAQRSTAFAWIHTYRTEIVPLRRTGLSKVVHKQCTFAATHSCGAPGADESRVGAMQTWAAVQPIVQVQRENANPLSEGAHRPKRHQIVVLQMWFMCSRIPTQGPASTTHVWPYQSVSVHVSALSAWIHESVQFGAAWE